MAHLDAALRAWVDGPWARALQITPGLTDTGSQTTPEFAQIATWSAECARAWGVASIQYGEAVAILAMPPGSVDLHRCQLRAEDQPTSGARVTVVPGSLRWRSPPGFPAPTPLPIPTVVDPPATEQPDASVVWILLAPSVAPVPTSCSLQLAIPMTGGQVKAVEVNLNATTTWLT